MVVIMMMKVAGLESIGAVSAGRARAVKPHVTRLAAACLLPASVSISQHQ
jgi:hypothetical protein